MTTQTLTRPVVQAAPVAPAAPTTSSRVLKPGMYRGLTAAEYGLWRLRPDGIWLFCSPVFGAYWKRAEDQNPGDKLIMLVDETRL